MGNLFSSEELENLDEPDDSNNIEQQESEEDEQLDLSFLPQDLLHRIIEKLEYREFFILDQSSLLGNHICSTGSYCLPFKAKNVYVNKRRTKVVEWYNDWLPFVERRIPWHVASCPPVRIVTDFVRIECRASSGRINAVSKLFENNHTYADMVSITEHIVFKPEDLERLLKSCNARILHSQMYLARGFFQFPFIQNMTTLDLENTGCTDEEFLKLKVNDYFRMRNDQITAKGLNKFLKQWKNKERELFLVKIDYDTTVGVRRFEEILEGVDANPIWTPELHENSVIGGIPIEELQRAQMQDPEHVYCIWRPEEPENTVFVFLTSRGIEIRQHSREADYLYYELEFDQYYHLLGRCVFCDKEFCYHRGRFSIFRLKKNFPKIHSSILCGVKILTILSASTRFVNFLIGERPFTRFPLMDHPAVGYKFGLSRVLSLLQKYILDHV